MNDHTIRISQIKHKQVKHPSVLHYPHGHDAIFPGNLDKRIIRKTRVRCPFGHVSFFS